MKVKIPYIGRRIVNDKVRQAFVHNGKECYFSGVKRLWIGSLYEAETKPKDGLSISVRPKEFEGTFSDDEMNLWNAKDAAAANEAKRIRAVAKAAKHPKLVEICNGLKPLVKGLNHSELRDVVDFIINELGREEREKWNREMNERLQRAAKNAFKRGYANGAGPSTPIKGKAK